MVDAAKLSALSDALIEEGAFCVDVADAEAGTQRETPIFGEPGQDLDVAFGLNRVIALFAPKADLPEALERALTAAGFSTTSDYKITEVAEQDWLKLTQSQFDPIHVSARLWIVPSWHAIPDPAAINIILDPGLAFGTGAHPTTRLCLDWLDRHTSRGCSVIDYGCGSGILAIAAVKMGAASATGVDVDSQAIRASRDNAKANKVDNIGFYLPDDAPSGIYDLVLANILTNPLRMLAPILANATRQGGRIVLSGILEKQAQDVMNIYDQWFDLNPPVFEEGWSCLSGHRR